ncbi:MAG TPA: universal stress protein [Gemmatimonadaceae bacterium]|nr:universal stress protein [Gemmatimonadaceae bacterium]
MAAVADVRLLGRVMYRRILVPVEHSPYDAVILGHVRQLALLCHSSLVLVHVADGFAARNAHQLGLRESEEMQRDREYLDDLAAALCGEGFEAEAVLAAGDPATEISQVAQAEGCDLIAMSTHGHRFLADLVLGSVANEVRHRSTVPVLLVRGTPRGTAAHAPAPGAGSAT